MRAKGLIILPFTFIFFLCQTVIASPFFSSRIDYPVGTRPDSFAVGDLNGDGDLDLVLANEESGNVGNVSVLSGNGDGTFQAAVGYGAADGAYSVAAGDLDGDGDLDLAVANVYRDNVSVLINLSLSKPFPDIKANASDGPLSIPHGDPLTVSISLDVGDYGGANADWFVLAKTKNGWYHYTGSGWVPGLTVTYQGPLRSVSNRPVLNSSSVPVGSYRFYFALDMNMNGSVDMDQIYSDDVDVEIIP